MKHRVGHAMWYALGRAGLVGIWALLVAVPLYGPFMGGLEGRFFPVTSGVKIVTQTQADGGLELEFTYSKYRQCEFIGANAEKHGEFVPFFLLGDGPFTRGVGTQVSREWYLGAASLSGLEIWFIHRCGLLWITTTKVLGP